MEPFKCSFKVILRETSHPAYRNKAEVLISHAWSQMFLNLVDILGIISETPCYCHLVGFILKQPTLKATLLEYDWWATTFWDTIRDFESTEMVLIPWNNPRHVALGRCCTHATACRFEVALNGKGIADLSNMDSTN